MQPETLDIETELAFEMYEVGIVPFFNPSTSSCVKYTIAKNTSRSNNYFTLDMLARGSIYSGYEQGERSRTVIE